MLSRARFDLVAGGGLASFGVGTWARGVGGELGVIGRGNGRIRIHGRTEVVSSRFSDL